MAASESPYRRQHPELFPYYCKSCVPERRFRLQQDKAQHDRVKHGNQSPTYWNTQARSFSPSTFRTPQMSSSTSLSPLSAVTTIELNSFVQNQLQPDTEYNKSCNAVVDRLCQFMQNSLPDELRPSEVRKSGSLGKGTAVKGKSDADLVVFLARFGTMTDLRKNLPSILERMKTYLGTYGGCDVTGTTLHAVKVAVPCYGHSHDIDILPSVNIVNKMTTRKIYEEMAALSPYIREYYSAALGPLQIEFVSGRPAKVKNLIRLMKYWRKTDFEHWISTIAVFLPPYSHIGEWEDAGGPEDFDLRKGFYHVLKAVANYKNLKRVWTRNYMSHYCSDPYCVMDPANPFNNVMNACNCWEMVADTARKFLRTAELFKGPPMNMGGWL